MRIVMQGCLESGVMHLPVIPALEVEAGRSRGQDHPLMHKFRDSLVMCDLACLSQYVCMTLNPHF